MEDRKLDGSSSGLYGFVPNGSRRLGVGVVISVGCTDYLNNRFLKKIFY